jgi:hypothetical protein
LCRLLRSNKPDVAIPPDRTPDFTSVCCLLLSVCINRAPKQSPRLKRSLTTDIPRDRLGCLKEPQMAR